LRRPSIPSVDEPEDYFVLKPKHSAFYSTPLDTLFVHLKTEAVILAGLTTAACILLTSGEIYIRDLKLFVPSGLAFAKPTTVRRSISCGEISRPNSRENARRSGWQHAGESVFRAPLERELLGLV